MQAGHHTIGTHLRKAGWSPYCWNSPEEGRLVTNVAGYSLEDGRPVTTYLMVTHLMKEGWQYTVANSLDEGRLVITMVELETHLKKEGRATHFWRLA